MKLAYFENRTSIPCICGREGGFTFKRRDRFGISFDFVTCLQCGHVRIKNPLSEDATAEFYSSSDYRMMYSKGLSPKEAIRKRFAKAPNRDLLNYFSRLQLNGKTLVEWGCGGGWNLLPFKREGWQVIGFDLDVDYVSAGKSEYSLDLRVIPGDDESLDLPQNVDIILLYHVLEHARNPENMLRRLRNSCGEKTLLCIGVPFVEQIKSWGWNNFFHVAHIHYFTKSSLLDLVNRSGFEVTSQNDRLGVICVRKVASGVEIAYSMKRALGTGLMLVSGWSPRASIRSKTRQILAALGLLKQVRKTRRHTK